MTGAVNFPVLVSILGFLGTAFATIATWLTTAWATAIGWLTTHAAYRVFIYGILVTAFIAVNLAFTQALIAIMPASNDVINSGSTSGYASTLFDEFWNWYSFLKPPHLESYIGSITSTALAVYIFRNALFILNLKSQVLK